MAIKKESSKKRHNRLHPLHEHHKTPDDLAPPEERQATQKGQASNNGGAILRDTGALSLPSEFTEKEEKEKGILGLEPVAFVILTFAILFIGFITYLISIEPQKTDDEPKPAAEAPAPK